MLRLLGFSAALTALVVAAPASAASPFALHQGPFPPSPAGASLEARAEQLVRTTRGGGAELAPRRTVHLANGVRVVRFAQMHQGLPVVQRGATVTFAKDGAPRLLALRLEDALPLDVTPAVGPNAAAALASRAGGVPASPSSARLAIWAGAASARLVWVVETRVFGLPTAPVVVVDAKTGALVLRYDAGRRLNEAHVYPTNPVRSPELAFVTLPVAEASTTLTNASVISYNCIDNETTQFVKDVDVHVCEPTQTAVADGDGNFPYAPAGDTAPEDPYSEVSLFHHVNRAYTFFRGFDPGLDVNGGSPIPTVSNLRLAVGIDTFDPATVGDTTLPLEPFQNAFFTPNSGLFGTLFGLSGNAMFFGQGEESDHAYDGDVAYHEFGHAVVHVTLSLVGHAHLDAFGASVAPAAMNEGLADYFSSALAKDPHVGEYSAKDFGKVDDIRMLANEDACPGSIGGEEHQDSTLFSGALWDVRSELPGKKKDAFDLSVYTAMNASPTGDLGYADFAAIVREAVVADEDLGESVAEIFDAALEKHGIVPACNRVIEDTGTVLGGPGDLFGFWYAPGTASTGAVAEDGGWTPGVVQFHKTLEPDTEAITVTFLGANAPGGFPFGGGGATPFAPKLLVVFDEGPIGFTVGPLATDVPVTVLDAATGSVSIPVPKAAKEMFLMIVNAGERDGAYSLLSLTPQFPPVVTGPSSVAASGGAGGAGGSGGGSFKEDDVGGGGCGCRIEGRGEPTGAAFAFALGAAFAWARSRRRRRCA